MNINKESMSDKDLKLIKELNPKVLIFLEETITACDPSYSSKFNILSDYNSVLYKSADILISGHRAACNGRKREWETSLSNMILGSKRHFSDLARLSEKMFRFAIKNPLHPMYLSVHWDNLHASFYLYEETMSSIADETSLNDYIEHVCMLDVSNYVELVEAGCVLQENRHIVADFLDNFARAGMTMLDEYDAAFGISQ
jgi:hypothetical protein